LISLNKTIIFLIIATGGYIIFLFLIRNNSVIINNSKNNIEADAYFYTEMKTEYFKENIQ